ncbi:hypothetical protein JKF63_01687 [Porcisia hertigi]|uniref:Uncharacterized protein n=1 Tax=Porcisia hertigi TaxID=2761500 RepID=A0A836IER2_9TRYP|nr:hypothetical protein JKF63_01687 [Porcisia hertigi]
MSDFAAWRFGVTHRPQSSSSTPLPPPCDVYPTTSAATAAPLQPLQPPSAYSSTSYVPVSSAPTAPPFSASTPVEVNGCMAFTSHYSELDHMQNAVSHLQNVLRDICETEQHRGKKWLNVQPCVMHAVKLLAATMQTQSERMRQLENAVQQLQQSTAVLVRDREVKEERYRLDTAAHQEEVSDMNRRLAFLEAQQQLPRQQLDLQMSEVAKARCEEAMEARVAPLRQQLRQLRRRLHTALSRPHLAHSHRQMRSSSGSSDSSTSTVRDKHYVGDDDAVALPRHRRASASSLSSASSSSSFAYSTASLPCQPREFGRGVKTVTTGGPAFTTPSIPRGLASATAAVSPGTQKMMREVQRLRRQWRHFLQSVPAALHQGEDLFCDVGKGRDGSGTSRSPYRHRSHLSSKGARSDVANSGVEGNTGGDMMSATRGSVLRPFCLWAPHSFSRVKDSVECSPHPRRAPSGASAAAFPSALPASGRRLRWYWSGDAQSHFSTAVRRAEAGLTAATLSKSRLQTAPGGVSPALPWTECHAFDGRTDCWYCLGSWATYRRHLREMEQTVEKNTSGSIGDARIGWMTWTSSLVSWRDIPTMVVERAGIYMVRVCLVRYCASASLCSGAGRGESSCRHHNCGGALTLWMNGVAVAGMREEVTHTLLYAHDVTFSAGAASPWRAALDKSPCACASAGTTNRFTSDSRRHTPASASRGGSPAQRRSHGDITETTQRPRPCCEPAQLHTNTLTAHLLLPAGATLQVRCRGLHDTKTVHEAFCEFECLV